MSAVSASSATSGSLKLDPVRALQHALYRAAKADPGRRFHALGDKVHRRDVLRRAWATVRRNNGAPGIDATTLAQVEEYGIDRLLGELAVGGHVIPHDLHDQRHVIPHPRVHDSPPGRRTSTVPPTMLELA
ncbi:hypothetical protein QCN29_36335 [Streptomyces sp. HNM0663]|uniref:RNA-directed DNA polymerase n=1 Tax=Streptomyces chengmaiensis TaxID=3040919 RepID=A0ABT6HZG6_9ACTN|nr:hypothetical protein [Streptomyces chengmaiensis]MDH2394109.1 hypothetical protein [Streptomyces chengmaiensis]